MRLDIIQKFIKENDYKSYLEIGVDSGQVFNNIDIKKVGVDPSAKTQKLVDGVLQMTSDEYFEKHKDDHFDIIFIDGLHHWEQVLRDINNSLDVLNEDGTIVCHDMLPPNEEVQKVPRQTKQWTGDCWKAWAHLRATNKNLSMFVYDTDYGVGVIKRGKQKLIKKENFDWSWFKANRSKLNVKEYSGQ